MERKGGVDRPLKASCSASMCVMMWSDELRAVFIPWNWDLWCCTCHPTRWGCHDGGHGQIPAASGPQRARGRLSPPGRIHGVQHRSPLSQVSLRLYSYIVEINLCRLQCTGIALEICLFPSEASIKGPVCEILWHLMVKKNQHITYKGNPCFLMSHLAVMSG